MSSPLHRRAFLASLAVGPHLLAQDKPAVAPPPRRVKGFAPDTLFLTWQRDPTTTTTIQWIGKDTQADIAVRYSVHKTNAWTPGPAVARAPFPVGETLLGKAFGPTGLTVFRAELTGLLPGTEYEFRIGATSPAFRFRTMPAKATRAFTFVSGGDCGTNLHALNNNKIAARQDPMFALIGGDLGYDNGWDGSTAVQFIRNYSTTMTDTQGRLIPLVVCVGNHEVAGSYNKTLKEATFFTPLFGGLFKDTSYATLDFGDYLSLVLLDSGHCATIGGKQTDWLDKAMKDRAGLPHLIAVNHVPCYPSFRPPETAGGKAGTGSDQRKFWVPLFEKHQVDVVLEHHDHTFKRTHPLKGGAVDEKLGIVYLGDGSWGRLRVPAKAENRPYLADATTAYHMTLHRLEGEQRFHMATDEFGKVLDITRTTDRKSVV